MRLSSSLSRVQYNLGRYRSIIRSLTVKALNGFRPDKSAAGLSRFLLQAFACQLRRANELTAMSLETLVLAGAFPPHQGIGVFSPFNIALAGGCKLARVLQQLTLLVSSLEQAGLKLQAGTAGFEGLLRIKQSSFGHS